MDNSAFTGVKFHVPFQRQTGIFPQLFHLKLSAYYVNPSVFTCIGLWPLSILSALSARSKILKKVSSSQLFQRKHINVNFNGHR